MLRARRFVRTIGASAILIGGWGVSGYWRPARPIPETCPCEVETIDAPAHSAPAAPASAAPSSEAPVKPPTIPDEELVDQDGRTVRFYSDLVRGKVVAIQFIFTTCASVCPPLGTAFATLRAREPDVQFISVSVDPVTDTPERLNAWCRRFGAGPNWRLVTGAKPAVDRVLRALRAYDANKNEHTPLFLLGDDRGGKWRRVHGLATPETIARVITAIRGDSPSKADSMPDPKPADTQPSSAASAPERGARSRGRGRRYFTDTLLVDQHGAQLKLYTDLISDRVVAVNFFFTSCKNTCPVLMDKFQKLQQSFQDRMGRDLVLLSISVDPARDDVARLKGFADGLGARADWHLVTGTADDLKVVQSRFGQLLDSPDQHTNVIFVGNERTGLWKKLNGLSPVEQLIPLVEEVLDDTEATQPVAASGNSLDPD
jgi:cytochrome oxidase Cu insertion factor (SCO1/SenC/PrrC family)